MTINKAPEVRDSFLVEDYLLYLLARASALTSRQFHAVVRERGLGVAEWRVLAALGEQSRSVGELADLTLLQQSTLSKVVDRMSGQGWVRRKPASGHGSSAGSGMAHRGDGRVVFVEITAQGRHMVADLQAEALHHERTILADYSGEEARRLKNMLKELIDRSAARQ